MSFWGLLQQTLLTDNILSSHVCVQIWPNGPTPAVRWCIVSFDSWTRNGAPKNHIKIVLPILEGAILVQFFGMSVSTWHVPLAILKGDPVNGPGDPMGVISFPPGNMRMTSPPHLYQCQSLGSKRTSGKNGARTRNDFRKEFVWDQFKFLGWLIID